MGLPAWADERPSSAGGRRQKIVRRAAWLFLGLCAFVIFPTVTDLLGIPLFTWPSLQKLVGRGEPPSRTGRTTSQRDLLALEYISEREPPLGFEQWVKFARQNQCHLGPYSRIDKDLRAFRDGRYPRKRSINLAQLEAAKQLPRVVVFTVRNGRLKYNSEGTANFAARFAGLMTRFVRFLPDMEFVVNDMDEPRILPGVEDDVDARFASLQCANASEDFLRFRHLHGSINSRPTGAMYRPSKELLPVFSQSKINECYADLTYPTLYGLDNLLTPAQEREMPPWRERNDTLFFRGATSGGHYKVDTDFTLAHRQRLVELARGKPHMDIAFHAFLQCDENVCKKMRAHYGQGSSVHQMDNFDYKFLMSIDGNTFVSRLPLFLSSGSVAFRAGLYSEWFDEWVRPGVHYLQVSLDYSNLESQLQWAMQNDDKARMIGQQGRDFALRHLRNQDMECYLFRLLLEYAALLQSYQ